MATMVYNTNRTAIKRHGTSKCVVVVKKLSILFYRGIWKTLKLYARKVVKCKQNFKDPSSRA